MDAVQYEDETSATKRTSAVKLTSLAPTFDEEQHQTYLSRLEEQIEEPDNLNIALTGRYGAGKSSVLNKFAETRSQPPLRLAISTLGPNGDGSTLTNRIQKELVKQIVYSAAPETLRHSQFRRRTPFLLPRVIGEAVVVVGLTVAFLALLGWLPTVVGTGPDSHWFLGVLAWLGLAVVAIATYVLLRWVTHERFVVSGVSAGGATLKLSKRAHTYFDEYLDDIVNYFDTENIDIVIFEDLDRFNDPQIFEALRELNTLLNNTQKRTERETPLRFIYAVRDSLFEKLGNDAETEGDDAVTAETERANRTKFFDLVIPMVPFISHRNARELLTDLLKDAGIASIDRRLVNVVAQHSTDMRLLHNISNEYLVFAERLLESEKVAPGLTPSNLFALVVYKNFHLKDFENIARRTSDLDDLYDFRRKLVRESIAAKQQHKRDLVSGWTQPPLRSALAQKLGSRLLAVSNLARRAARRSNMTRLRFRVEERDFSEDEVVSFEFWQVASRAKNLTITASGPPGNGKYDLIVLNKADLEAVTEHEMKPEQWDDIDVEAVNRELSDVERDITFLRRADFVDLSRSCVYKLAWPSFIHDITDDTDAEKSATPVKATAVDRSFSELVDETMKSELSRQLVRRGYIDRNFALYAAQFYGHFTGIDVANFMVQNVQTNTMEIDYPFTGPDAVANLLAEADDDFTETVAAFNIDVLDHLLNTKDKRASNIVHHLASDFNADARTFMAAYLTSGAHTEELSAQLAGDAWSEIFNHLVTDDDVPGDKRPALVNAALSAVDPDQTYELTQSVNDFIAEYYGDMAVFTRPQNQNIVANVVTFLQRADILIPDIGALDERMSDHIVSNNQYQITATNLHHALGPEDTAVNTIGIGLDRVRESQDVYEYCVAHPEDYQAAFEEDDGTPYTVFSSDTLIALVDDAVETWDKEQLADVIRRSAPESEVHNLTSVPVLVWPILADAGRFRVSLANVERYRQEVGSIDEHLAKMLENEETIRTEEIVDTTDDAGEKIDAQAAAITILNAQTITEPAIRVAVASSLNPEAPLQVRDIHPEASELFVQLLQNELIADDAESFSHFREAGWSAIGPAVAASQNITKFLTPDLIQGFVADALNGAETRDKIGHKIVTNVDEFVPDDNPTVLTALAKYVDSRGMTLTPETGVRIAKVRDSTQRPVLQLLQAAEPEATADHIYDVFTAIGVPYSNINQAGKQFEVEKDELHTALLTTLQDGKVCTFRKKRAKELYTVNVE
ncbi:MAG: hypothetical protein L0H57_10180 [Yaniella sp.]|nr:hypothetical protein [Yaniella sp.]